MKAVASRKDRGGRLIRTSLNSALFMPLRGARPLLLHEVRVGPALGLYAWFPADHSVADAYRLYAVLRGRAAEEVRTEVQLARYELVRGLDL